MSDVTVAEEALRAANQLAQEALPLFLRDEYFKYYTSAALFILALIPIHIGAHRSVEDVVSKKKKEEVMTSKDAYMFPVYGSCFLFGLYLLFKVFNKEWLNFLLTGYFLLAGEFALTASARPFVAPYAPKEWSTKHKFERKISFLQPLGSLISDLKEPLNLSVTLLDLVSFLLASVLVLWYITTKHWVANNLLGLAFCIQAIEMLNIGSYKTGCILLSGLFFYDIFWVFGTDVMVTVAKSFDAPIKLVFPKSLTHTPVQLSLLGLGDIVIPGIFMALCLRFDAANERARLAAKGGKTAAFSAKGGFPKPYWTAVFAGYVAGLLTTMLVMHVFKAAQPALLYLVPGCIGSTAITALVRGEFTKLWEYAEDVAEEDAADGKKKKN